MTQNFFQSFILLLLVTDPFGNVPLFVSTLANVPTARRGRVIMRECMIAFLQLTDIALRIGGGVILFLIALRMVFPQHGSVVGDGETASEPYIVPLAIPALAGPSALVTVLLFSSNSAAETMLHVAVLSSVAVVWLVVLLSAERMQRALGPKVMTAFERLMGLILTAMAVEMLLAGIRAYIKSL
jgi:small neutral amino acid transporter SnatA (MarC family)